MTPLLIFGSFIALMILLGTCSYKSNRARIESLMKLAADRGWQFRPDNDGTLWQRYQHFPTFTRGDNRVADNLLSGLLTVDDWSLPLVAGDYRYDTESGTGKNRRRTTHRLGFLIVRFPVPVRSNITLRPEGITDRIAGAMGFEDIDFESAEFSKKFHVTGDDRKLVYDLFDPRMIEWLLTVRVPALTIAADEMCIVGGRADGESLGRQIDFVREFVARWPGHVRQRLASTGPGGAS
jgi:hypothetical protein